MIERLYLDNIRSFVNFEWRPGRLALLLGANGSGKTALLETLAFVRDFLMGDRSVSEAFPSVSRTRWDTRSEQTVEIDARLPAGLYRYRLVVVHDLKDPEHPLVKSESLHLDDRPVVENLSGELQVYSAPDAGVIRRTRATRSAIGVLDPGRDPILHEFLYWLTMIQLFRPDPRAMSARFDRRHAGTVPPLAHNLSNFAAYYPPTLAAKPGAMFKAMRALEPALPGLIELRANEGELEARFEREGVTSSYSFDELSDGERSLVALYVVLHALAIPGTVLLLDEPDNYLGLREIQPFLAELTDRALKSDGPQVILVSHHPEALNFLAPERGYRMFRDANGPTRIERFKPQEGLRPDEMVARGWDDPR
jgi:predicted ATPase